MKKAKSHGKASRIKWGRILLITAGAAFIVLSLFFASVYWGWWGTFDPAKLDMNQSALIYDSSGQLVTGIHGLENRVKVNLEEIPLHIRNAFLAAEDLRFYSHTGVDVIRIGGALLSDIRTGSLGQGASTITQQLIKNTHLTSAKTWSRKLEEAYLAIQLEKAYTKDEILETYMNQVYLGNGAYGVQAAARAYFGKDIGELDIAEGATLAAILKSPTNYAPHLYPDNAKRRRDLILSTMETEEMITRGEAERARLKPLDIVSNTGTRAGGWYVDEALREAERVLGLDADELMVSGVRIHTALNPAIQSAAEAAAADAALFPKDAADGAPCQCAIVVMDAWDGAVRALVGGREQTGRRVFNRATDMRRQPGSALKPLVVYAPAVETGIVTPLTVLNDEPTSFDGYAPDNFGSKFHGSVTARQALAQSYNVPAVSLLSDMGVEMGRDYLERFGLKLDSRDAYLPLALGAMTNGVTPLELGAAFSALATDGCSAAPYLVTYIEDSSGHELYRAKPQRTRAVEDWTAAIVTDMLRTTVAEGTAKRLNGLGFEVAAKTGTVDYGGAGNRDAWVVAMTPATVTTVWMGFDNTDAKHILDNSVTGGTLPTDIARLILEEADGGGAFKLPRSVQALRLDRLTYEATGEALLATDITPDKYAFTELFGPVNMPTTSSPRWGIPRPPSDFSVSRGEDGLPLISFTILDQTARYRLFRTRGLESPQELMSFTGGEGDIVNYLDETAERVTTYTYHIVPENALSADEGIDAAGPSGARLAYSVPLLSFEIPQDWFGGLLRPAGTPEPETSEPEEIPEETPEPDETPEPEATPTPLPIP